jgi:hypothetical protein
MLLFSTEQSLPNDIINRITDFLTTGLFVLDGLCKSSRNLEDKQNPNVIKLPSIDVFLRLRHHGLKFALDLSFSNITDVSDLRYVHTVNLTGCHNITDVSPLRGVHTVDLTGCRNLTDISALRGVHTVDLTGCRNIIDVSALCDSHTINLSFCYGVTDVSALRDAHTVDLSDTEVTYVSDLGGVRKLDLRWCHGVTDFSMLGKGGQILIR